MSRQTNNLEGTSVDTTPHTSKSRHLQISPRPLIQKKEEKESDLSHRTFEFDDSKVYSEEEITEVIRWHHYHSSKEGK